jgi:hypothetical protein
MKKNIFYSVCLLGVFCILLMGCATQRPFKKTYKGEAEQLLSGTRWELYDLKSNDNFSIIVEFHVDGTLSWYNIPDNYNGFISEKSTWERNSNDLVFNARNGFYLYEGKINGDSAIVGRYKTGYDPRFESQPVGDFTMKKL